MPAGQCKGIDVTASNHPDRDWLIRGIGVLRNSLRHLVDVAGDGSVFHDVNSLLDRSGVLLAEFLLFSVEYQFPTEVDWKNLRCPIALMSQTGFLHL